MLHKPPVSVNSSWQWAVSIWGGGCLRKNMDFHKFPVGNKGHHPVFLHVHYGLTFKVEKQFPRDSPSPAPTESLVPAPIPTLQQIPTSARSSPKAVLSRSEILSKAMKRKNYCKGKKQLCKQAPQAPPQKVSLPCYKSGTGPCKTSR